MYPIHLNAKWRQRRVVYPYQFSNSPAYIVYDIHWLDYHCDNTHWFFNGFPLRKIIEVVASVPTYCDYSQLFWDEVECTFDSRTLETADLTAIEALVESVVELFYNGISELIPYSDENYVFKEWLDNNTVVMIRENELRATLR